METNIASLAKSIVQTLRASSNADVDYALVGGALRDREFNIQTGSNVQPKDFDFILMGDASMYYDKLYGAFKESKIITLKRYVDSYHSPRIARRGLAGVFMLEIDGLSVDVLCYEEEMTSGTVMQEVGKFDMDVNQAAAFFLLHETKMLSTPAFEEAHKNKTFKIVDREETEDGGFSAREMQRLAKIQNKLAGYEMLDFPEFMERLDYFGGIEAALQASKPSVATIIPQGSTPPAPFIPYPEDIKFK